MADHLYDVVIVGAGPAGLSAGVEAAHAGLEHLVLEKEKLMQTLLTFYPEDKPVVMDWHGVQQGVRTIADIRKKV